MLISGLEGLAEFQRTVTATRHAGEDAEERLRAQVHVYVRQGERTGSLIDRLAKRWLDRDTEPASARQGAIADERIGRFAQLLSALPREVEIPTWGPVELKTAATQSDHGTWSERLEANVSNRRRGADMADILNEVSHAVATLEAARLRFDLARMRMSEE